VALTVVTWNLKGSAGPDLAVVAEHLRKVGADVVALQECQRRHARELGHMLGARSVGWGFKHFPVRTWSEGMAVLGLTVPVAVDTSALSFRWRPWSFRRRIFQVAEVGGDVPFTLVNLHLSTAREAERRAVEVTTVLRVLAAASGESVVVGDLNDKPGAPLFGQFAEAGLRDAWVEARPDATPAESTTNWGGWVAGTPEDPSRRLDYVLVSAGLAAEGAELPRPGDDGFDAFRTLSDHLPLAVTLAAGGPRPG
jgi:endonuclease/exonuclease/phosphatase family metal-dependent hydrolase